MSDNHWRRVPVGPDADRWVTRRARKTVLVVVHTVTSGQRLLEAAGLLEDDLRIQVVFTRAPDVFGDDVPDFLAGIGAVVLPWQQATRTRFDLALAASLGGIHELHAPVVVMPHGAGFNKLVSRRAGRAAGSRMVYGLDAQRLVHDGALIPASLVLPHREQLRHLGRSCPEAVPVAEVVGDPCFDRLMATLPRRAAYQVALGAGDGRKLVVVASTWGPASLLGRRPDLWRRLLTELPPREYRVVAMLHPNVWSGSGTWQVRAWLADCLRRGLGLVPPDSDWRGVVAAADWFVGDHGSVALYAPAAGVPTLFGAFSAADVDPGSPMAELAGLAPHLSARGSLRRQLDQAAAGFRPERYQGVVGRITSEPGRFNRNMRQLMYRLLRLRAPATVPTTRPADPPVLHG
ncbi:MAG TPA: hypothetical protein VHJ17_20850 [Thermomonospora sp.]|nr:hypothetical protein [Thermomonospora sp.]